MGELVFRKDLYAGEAVDAAARAFAGVARVELEAREDFWIVRYTPASGHDDARLGDEFCNYVLGATVEARRG